MEIFLRSKVPKILFLGGLNYAKGSSVVEELSRVNEIHKSFKFELLGEISITSHISGLTRHGKYHQHELSEKLDLISPDFIMIPSIWPETYGFVADEVIENGFSLIAFNFGGIYERFKDTPNTHFIDLKSPKEIYASLIALIENDCDV